MRVGLLLGCLGLSGFSGLAYELLWVRLLALSYGSTTASLSAVLAVFFGGLALGSRLAGGLAEKVRSPVRAYAWTEAVMAVTGLLLYPVLLNLDDLFARLDPGGASWGGAAARVLVTLPLLLGPTMLMGATLPLMIRALGENDRQVGARTAAIYGVNTLGAALGAYFTTYWGIALLGVGGLVVCTAVVNGAAAVGAFALSRRIEKGPLWEDGFGAQWPWGRRRRPGPVGSARRNVGRTERLAERVALGVAWLTGFSFIALEIVWTRVFSVALHGTIYGVGAVLIAVLAGIGLGGVAAGPVLSRLEKRGWDLGLVLAALQWAGVLCTLGILSGLVPTAYLLNTLAGVVGGRTGIHLQLAWVVLCLLPSTFASGMAFPLLVRRLETRASDTPRALARLYVANTLGSVLGSLVTGFWLLPRVGSESSLLLILGMALAGAALSAAFLSEEKRRRWAAPVALAIAATLGLYRGFPAPELTLASNTYGRDYAGFRQQIQAGVAAQLFFAEGETANVIVSGAGQSRSLTLNGLGQGGYSEAPPHHIFESLLVGMVPLAHIEAPRNALVVGLGAGSTVDYLLRKQVPRITVLELEPAVVQASNLIFGGKGPAQDPRVDVQVGDARHFLRVNLRQSDVRYDLLTSMPAHPWVAAPIFTQEFFELARDSLSVRGVFATWFGYPQMPPQAIGSLMAAFTQTFTHYIVYQIDEVGAYYLVGSRAPLQLDPAYLARLQASPWEQAHLLLRSPSFLPRRVFASGDASTERPEARLANRDGRPIVEVLAPLGVGKPTGGEAPRWLADEYLRPEAVRSPQPLLLVKTWLEELLGTPDGRVGAFHFTPRISTAERWLKGLGPRLTAAERDYFLGRIELLKEKPELARAAFRAAARSWPPGDGRLAYWRGRADRMFDSEFDLAGVVGLDHEDLKVRTGGWREALARVSPAGWGGDDPIRWWIEAAARGPRFRPQDHAWLQNHWLPFVPVLQRRSLAALCREMAENSGPEYVGLATSCRRHEERLAANQAYRAMREAARQVKAGRGAAGLAAVEWALTAVPGQESVILGAMEVGLRAGKQALLQRAYRDLAWLGWSEEAVRAAERGLAQAIEKEKVAVESAATSVEAKP